MEVELIFPKRTIPGVVDSCGQPIVPRVDDKVVANGTLWVVTEVRWSFETKFVGVYLQPNR